MVTFREWNKLSVVDREKLLRTSLAGLSKDELRAAHEAARNLLDSARRRQWFAEEQRKAVFDQYRAEVEARIWSEHPDWKRDSKVTQGKVSRKALEEATLDLLRISL